MTRPANLGRDFKPDDPKIAEFVEWVQSNGNETWQSYLVIKGLDAHLAKYVSSSPFERGTPIDTRILQLIHKFWPELTTIESSTFRGAVGGYIHQNNLVKKTFRHYREPL